MEQKRILNKIKSSTGREKFSALLEYSYFLRQKNPDHSIKVANQAAELAKELKDDNLYVGAIVFRSYAYLYKDDYEEAHNQAHSLLKEAKHLNSPRGMGSAYDIEGSIFTKEGKLTEAIDSFLKALDHFLKTDDKENLLIVYNNLGRVHLMKVELDEASTYLKLALSYADELDSPAKYPIRMNLANVIFNQNKYEEALRIYKQSAEYFHEEDKLIYEASALFNMGLCYSSLNNNSEALKYYEQVYEIYKKKNVYENLVNTARTIAEVLIIQNRSAEALPYLNEAEEIAENNDMPGMLRDVYSAFSKYYQNTKDYQKAIEYLKKYITTDKQYQSRINEESISELEAKYKTEIFKLKNKDLSKKNKTMKKQLGYLKSSLSKLQSTHENLQNEFKEKAEKIDKQDNLITAQARNSAIGEMISAIAHQWKQPLNVIWLLAQAIGDAWDFEEIDDDFMENQLNLIGSQIHYMNDTISDFKNFFKQDYYDSFFISETIENSIKLVQYILDKENIIINKKLDPLCKISGNPNELSQVLINIINNAKDALIENKTKKAEINISLDCNEENVYIRIANNGKKIEPEHLDKVFEPYFTTKEKTGTGLGLHICRKIIVNKFHGDISVHNTDNGVEFTIIMKKTKD